MRNLFINLDKSISRVLNEWGTREIFFVQLLSEYLVFVVIALSFVWLMCLVYRRNKPFIDFKPFAKDLLLQGATLLVIPVGVATVISELISRFYVRQRPFAVMSDIQLLVPHSADGGMPSHHMVFMATVAFMVYLSNKRLGVILIGLSLISGVARISAGIHYPSDVLAGILFACINVVVYIQIIRVFLGSKSANYLWSK